MSLSEQQKELISKMRRDRVVEWSRILKSDVFSPLMVGGPILTLAVFALVKLGVYLFIPSPPFDPYLEVRSVSSSQKVFSYRCPTSDGTTYRTASITYPPGATLPEPPCKGFEVAQTDETGTCYRIYKTTLVDSYDITPCIWSESEVMDLMRDLSGKEPSVATTGSGPPVSGRSEPQTEARTHLSQSPTVEAHPNELTDEDPDESAVCL